MNPMPGLTSTSSITLGRAVTNCGSSLETASQGSAPKKDKTTEEIRTAFKLLTEAIKGDSVFEAHAHRDSDACAIELFYRNSP